MQVGAESWQCPPCSAHAGLTAPSGNLVPVPGSGGATGIPGRAWIDLGLPPLQSNDLPLPGCPCSSAPSLGIGTVLRIVPMDNNSFLWEKLVQGDTRSGFCEGVSVGQSCPGIWGETSEARKSGLEGKTAWRISWRERKTSWRERLLGGFFLGKISCSEGVLGGFLLGKDFLEDFWEGKAVAYIRPVYVVGKWKTAHLRRNEEKIEVKWRVSNTVAVTQRCRNLG